jgi:hypothetical protein
VYLGLEGGLTPHAMLELLRKHSPRPLPPGVPEALRTWSRRRDRVTYHAAATLVEFGSAGDLELALRGWPDLSLPPPVRISDRLLLVEDERAIPFDRFRQVGARDYRRPADVCVDVGPDGVSLTLDPARSDLLVDAELARFADESGADAPARGAAAGALRRRFTVSKDSLRRAAEAGMSEPLLTRWYQRRTGGDIPAAVRLLLLAAGPRVPSPAASRPWVVRTPTAELLDGLVQHPDTRNLLGERLGPTAVVVPTASLPALRRTLEALGFLLDVSDAD